MLKWKPYVDLGFVDSTNSYVIIKVGKTRYRLYTFESGRIGARMNEHSGLKTCIQLADELYYRDNALAHLAELVQECLK